MPKRGFTTMPVASSTACDSTPPPRRAGGAALRLTSVGCGARIFSSRLRAHGIRRGAASLKKQITEERGREYTSSSVLRRSRRAGLEGAAVAKRGGRMVSGRPPAVRTTRVRSVERPAHEVRIEPQAQDAPAWPPAGEAASPALQQTTTRDGRQCLRVRRRVPPRLSRRASRTALAPLASIVFEVAVDAAVIRIEGDAADRATATFASSSGTMPLSTRSRRGAPDRDSDGK